MNKPGKTFSSGSNIFDVVIIGSGLAGINSALHAAGKYQRVLVVTKAKIFDANSNYAQGGIAGVFEENDHHQKHIEDTLVAGAHHNKKKAVEYFVQNAAKAIHNLEKLGAGFETNHQKKFILHQEAGHQHRRIVHAGDHSGHNIMMALVKKIRSSENITIWENSFAEELTTKNKICFGVKVIRKNKRINIFGRRIIIATGGVGQVYQYTTNPSVTTGDGIALAAKAGCKIQDMEFIQFHPTAFAKGKSPLFLISETVRGEGGILKNAKHEAFMSNYHHLKDLAPRDIISRAIFAEQKKGQVYLDITQKTKSELKKHFPTIYKYLAENGYAMEKDLIPVAPAAHYTCGGVVTDLHGKTNIKNLFVVGEAACTGLHGANRLASNSLLEAAVMSEHVMDSPLPESKDFEEQMKKYSIQKEKTSNTNTKTQNQKILKKITKKDLNKISQLRKKLQEVMWKNAGIIRTEKMLKIGLLKIEQIKRSTGWITPSTKKIELENMIIISQIIISAALKRKKSLGAHRRLN